MILDKWDLREGQDKFAFMEKMVTDPEVTKVIAICDKQYAEKADGRSGGVGIESQIISKNVYEKINQKKFIPVLTERLPGGEECLPTFFGGRIYIDMSSPEKAFENYDQLLRTIYDRPIYKKPALGKPPSHLFGDAPPASKTQYKLEALIRAITEDKGSVPGLVADYLKNYSTALEDYRLAYAGGGNSEPFDEKVVASIEAFKSYRDEFAHFISFVARFRDDARTYDELFKFFEDILKYQHPLADRDSWFDKEFDNYCFIIRELFLYCLTALIKNGRFEQAGNLLSRPYLERSKVAHHGRRSGLVSFTAFDVIPETLEVDRKRRLGLNVISVTANLLRDRAYLPDYDMDSLMQTELILYLRSELHVGQNFNLGFWDPKTLSHSGNGVIFDIFLKAASKTYFRDLAILLGIKNKEELAKKIKQLEASREFNHFGYKALPLEDLSNLDRVDTQP